MSTQIPAKKPPLLTRPALASLGVVAVLAGACTLTFGPVFGGGPGYLAAGGGAALGLVIGWYTSWRRWGVLATAFLVLVAYLLFVGVLALPDTTILGFIPTLETLGRGSLLIVQAWRDLLTVAIPASSFSGPAVVPLLTGLVCVTLASRLALLPRRYLTAVLPLTAFLLVGILWGTSKTPFGVWIGLAFATILLGGAALRAAITRQSGAEDLGIDMPSRKTWPRLVAGLGVLALSGSVAVAAAPVLAGQQDRFVLRNVVVPPLDLREYASPLMSYRYFELDQKEVAQFSVTGLPADARIRLATLDSYDGIVYNVADSSAGFARAGAEIEPRNAAPTTEPVAELHVTVDEYQGVWLPGGGNLRGVSFEGQNASAQTKSLYYNSETGTALVTAGLSQEDSYTVQVILPPQVSEAELREYGVQSVALPTTSRVPDAVVKKASEVVEGANGQVGQILAIEAALQQGYYSDGSDGQSLSGHSEARISDFLSSRQMVGDDEQYAVAMALMLRQLGISARVVLGFYPAAGTATDGTWQATGTDAHVWVEVPFNEVGWVAFDPTPDRDRRPETTVPKPNPKPRPQVQPPPVPPKEPIETPQQLGEDKTKEDEAGVINWGLIRTIAMAVGGAGLLASPLLLIALLRKRRRSTRMNAELPADRLSGGWAEIMDAATDLGVRLEPRLTRREASVRLAEQAPEAELVQLANAIDYGVFGAGSPRDDYITQVWAQSAASIRSLRRSVPAKRRFAYWVRVSSFFQPALAGPIPPSKPGSRERLSRRIHDLTHR